MNKKFFFSYCSQPRHVEMEINKFIHQNFLQSNQQRVGHFHQAGTLTQRNFPIHLLSQFILILQQSEQPSRILQNLHIIYQSTSTTREHCLLSSVPSSEEHPLRNSFICNLENCSTLFSQIDIYIASPRFCEDFLKFYMHKCSLDQKG